MPADWDGRVRAGQAKRMGPDWLEGAHEPMEATLGGACGAGGPMYMRNASHPTEILSLHKELAVLGADLQGLDGNLRGLIDLLRPFFGAERPIPTSPELEERNSEGRSEAVSAVIAMSNQVRSLRSLLQRVGAALEL
jgi:hypothetical protein